MPMVPFGPWRPDMGIFATGAGEARNCIRSSNGYRPLASLASFGSGTVATRPSALLTARGNDGVMHCLAGDETKLYRLDASSTTFADVSKVGGYTTANERWRHVHWGNRLVMTNYNDPIQVTDLSSGLVFGDLSADAPKARFIAAAGPYLVVGDTQDTLDGQVPWRLRWCGIENIDAWVPSAETTADWQDVPDVGHLMGLTGGRQLTALFEDGIVIGTLVGAPKAFRFDRVEGAIGCIEPNSVIEYKARTYYLGRDGFQMFDGRQSHPIGMGKVNRWFFGDALFDKLHLMSVMVDRQQKIVIWLYCGAGSDGVTPNRALLYNYDENEFTRADMVAQIVGGFTTPGYNIDNIDSLSPPGTGVDGLPAPLDDPFYSGGIPIAGAFVDKQLYSLAGNPMVAGIDTPFLELAQPRRALLTEIRDVIEGDGQLTCQPYTLDDKLRTPREWPVANENGFGFYPVRAEGRYHKVRTVISGAWRSAFGLDITVRPIGGR